MKNSKKDEFKVTFSKGTQIKDFFIPQIKETDKRNVSSIVGVESNSITSSFSKPFSTGISFPPYNQENIDKINIFADLNIIQTISELPEVLKLRGIKVVSKSKSTKKATPAKDKDTITTNNLELEDKLKHNQLVDYLFEKNFIFKDSFPIVYPKTLKLNYSYSSNMKIDFQTILEDKDIIYESLDNIITNRKIFIEIFVGNTLTTKMKLCIVNFIRNNYNKALLLKKCIANYHDKSLFQIYLEEENRMFYQKDSPFNEYLKRLSTLSFINGTNNKETTNTAINAINTVNSSNLLNEKNKNLTSINSNNKINSNNSYQDIDSNQVNTNRVNNNAIDESSLIRSRKYHKSIFALLEAHKNSEVVNSTKRLETEEEKLARMKSLFPQGFLIEKSTSIVDENAIVNNNKAVNNKTDKKPKLSKQQEKLKKQQDEEYSKEVWIEEFHPGNINIKSMKNNKYSIWFGSVLQLILDLKITDVNNKETLFNKIYPQKNQTNCVSNYGKYAVKLFYMGEYKLIEIDEFFPYINNDSLDSLLPETENNNELWPMIVMKALIKLCSQSMMERFANFGGLNNICNNGLLRDKPVRNRTSNLNFNYINDDNYTSNNNYNQYFSSETIYESKEYLLNNSFYPKMLMEVGDTSLFYFLFGFCNIPTAKDMIKEFNLAQILSDDNYLSNKNYLLCFDLNNTLSLEQNTKTGNLSNNRFESPTKRFNSSFNNENENNDTIEERREERDRNMNVTSHSFNSSLKEVEKNKESNNPNSNTKRSYFSTNRNEINIDNNLIYRRCQTVSIKYVAGYNKMSCTYFNKILFSLYNPENLVNNNINSNGNIKETLNLKSQRSQLTQNINSTERNLSVLKEINSNSKRGTSITNNSKKTYTKADNIKSKVENYKKSVLLSNIDESSILSNNAKNKEVETLEPFFSPNQFYFLLNERDYDYNYLIKKRYNSVNSKRCLFNNKVTKTKLSEIITKSSYEDIKEDENNDNKSPDYNIKAEVKNNFDKAETKSKDYYKSLLRKSTLLIEPNERVNKIRDNLFLKHKTNYKEALENMNCVVNAKGNIIMLKPIFSLNIKQNSVVNYMNMTEFFKSEILAETTNTGKEEDLNNKEVNYLTITNEENKIYKIFNKNLNNNIAEEINYNAVAFLEIIFKTSITKFLSSYSFTQISKLVNYQSRFSILNNNFNYNKSLSSHYRSKGFYLSQYDNSINNSSEFFFLREIKITMINLELYVEIVDTIKQELKEKDEANKATINSNNNNTNIVSSPNNKVLLSTNDLIHKNNLNKDSRTKTTFYSNFIQKIKSKSNYLENKVFNTKKHLYLNSCYLITDFFHNYNFNVTTLKPLDFSDLHKKLSDNKINYKTLNKQEKKEYIEKIINLRTEIKQEKLNRIRNLVENTENKVFYVNIFGYGLTVFLDVKEESNLVLQITPGFSNNKLMTSKVSEYSLSNSNDLSNNINSNANMSSDVDNKHQTNKMLTKNYSHKTTRGSLIKKGTIASLNKFNLNSNNNNSNNRVFKVENSLRPIEYNHEQIYMGKKCIKNNWKIPPPEFFDELINKIEKDKEEREKKIQEKLQEKERLLKEKEDLKNNANKVKKEEDEENKSVSKTKSINKRKKRNNKDDLSIDNEDNLKISRNNSRPSKLAKLSIKLTASPVKKKKKLGDDSNNKILEEEEFKLVNNKDLKRNSIRNRNIDIDNKLKSALSSNNSSQDENKSLENKKNKSKLKKAKDKWSKDTYLSVVEDLSIYHNEVKEVLIRKPEGYWYHLENTLKHFNYLVLLWNCSKFKYSLSVSSLATNNCYAIDIPDFIDNSILGGNSNNNKNVKKQLKESISKNNLNNSVADNNTLTTDLQKEDFFSSNENLEVLVFSKNINDADISNFNNQTNNIKKKRINKKLNSIDSNIKLNSNEIDNNQDNKNSINDISNILLNEPNKCAFVIIFDTYSIERTSLISLSKNKLASFNDTYTNNTNNLNINKNTLNEKQIQNEIISFVNYDLFDQNHNFVSSFTLKGTHDMCYYDSLDPNINYYLVLKSCFTPLGYNLTIHSDLKCSNISETEHLINNKKFHKKNIIIPYNTIEKNTFQVLGKIEMKLSEINNNDSNNILDNTNTKNKEYNNLKINKVLSNNNKEEDNDDNTVNVNKEFISNIEVKIGFNNNSNNLNIISKTNIEKLIKLVLIVDYDELYYNSIIKSNNNNNEFEENFNQSLSLNNKLNINNNISNVVNNPNISLINNNSSQFLQHNLFNTINNNMNLNPSYQQSPNSSINNYSNNYTKNKYNVYSNVDELLNVTNFNKELLNNMSQNNLINNSTCIRNNDKDQINNDNKQYKSNNQRAKLLLFNETITLPTHQNYLLLITLQNESVLIPENYFSLDIISSVSLENKMKVLESVEPGEIKEPFIMNKGNYLLKDFLVVPDKVNITLYIRLYKYSKQATIEKINNFFNTTETKRDKKNTLNKKDKEAILSKPLQSQFAVLTLFTKVKFKLRVSITNTLTSNTIFESEFFNEMCVYNLNLERIIKESNNNNYTGNANTKLNNDKRKVLNKIMTNTIQETNTSKVEQTNQKLTGNNLYSNIFDNIFPYEINISICGVIYDDNISTYREINKQNFDLNAYLLSLSEKFNSEEFYNKDNKVYSPNYFSNINVKNKYNNDVDVEIRSKVNNKNGINDNLNKKLIFKEPEDKINRDKIIENNINDNFANNNEIKEKFCFDQDEEIVLSLSYFSTDNIVITKNACQEEAERMMINNWEILEPGRVKKASYTRNAFKKCYKQGLIKEPNDIKTYFKLVKLEEQEAKGKELIDHSNSNNTSSFYKKKSTLAVTTDYSKHAINDSTLSKINDNLFNVELETPLNKFEKTKKHLILDNNKRNNLNELSAKKLLAKHDYDSPTSKAVLNKIGKNNKINFSIKPQQQSLLQPKEILEATLRERKRYHFNEEQNSELAKTLDYALLKTTGLIKEGDRMERIENERNDRTSVLLNKNKISDNNFKKLNNRNAFNKNSMSQVNNIEEANYDFRGNSISMQKILIKPQKYTNYDYKDYLKYSFSKRAELVNCEYSNKKSK